MANRSQETWKQVTSLKGKTTRNYAVSNQGRLASYSGDINDKLLLKPHLNGGFPLISVNVEGKSKALFIHQAVAEAFLKKSNAKKDHVIHLDHNKANNDVSNLKWVSQKEQIEHNKQSPKVLEAIARKIHKGATAKKLNEKKVMQLKKELWDPKRKLTMKKLAEKYGIAEMNLYRIKSGELWFHVHVDGEPLFAKYKEQLKNIALKNKQEAKQTAARVAQQAKKAAANLPAAVSVLAGKKKKQKKSDKKAELNNLPEKQKEKALKVKKKDEKKQEKKSKKQKHKKGKKK